MTLPEMKFLDKELKGITGKFIVYLISCTFFILAGIFAAYYGILISNHDLINAINQEKDARGDYNKIQDIRLDHLEQRQADIQHQEELNTSEMQTIYLKIFH